MAVPTVTKIFTELDGTDREFVFAKMNAVDALRVYYPLARILPPIFAALAPSALKQQENSAKRDGDLSKLRGALDALTGATEEAAFSTLIDGVTSRFSADDLIAMMQIVFKSVRLKIPPDRLESVDMGIHFGGGLSKTMLLVFVEALRVNFSDFFGAGRSASSPAGKPAA